MKHVSFDNTVDSTRRLESNKREYNVNIYIYYPFLNISYVFLDSYVTKAITAVLSLVRGWRSSTKQNTLSFFGINVEF